MLSKDDFSYSIDEDLIHYTIINNATNEGISGVLTEEFKTAEEQICEYINSYVNMVNSQMPIDKLKDDYIRYSKKLLEEYLLNHPLKSSVHNNEDKYYSITSEKQVLLTKEILMCQMSQFNNTEYIPGWNATGEAGTYDWTLEELMQLSHEISLFVKPKILKQQLIEEAIKNALTVEEIMAIDISYDD